VVYVGFYGCMAATRLVVPESSIDLTGIHLVKMERKRSLRQCRACLCFR
jgi:hypothetical protein